MTTLDQFETLPDPSDVSPMRTGIKYGIILTLAGVILQLVMYITDTADTAGGSGNGSLSFLLGILAFAMTIAIIVVGVKYHRDQELGGFISFRRAMGVCFWIGVSNGILNSIWTWLYQNIIAPDSLEPLKREVEMARVQVEDGEAPEWVLTLVEWTYTSVTNPIYLVFWALLSVLFLGLFISLFTKRERPII